MIGRGIITSRPIDGKKYLDNSAEYPNVKVNYTKSRKEVRFHQLVSRSCVIPHITSYYEEGTKFVDVFGEVSRFQCLIAESYLGIDELAMEGEMIEAILEGVDTEDFGDREPGGELLLIGTDDEVRGLMERDRQRERLYVSRNDERLMLNENHEDYLMENEE